MSAKCNMTPASQLYLNSLVMWLNILYFTWGNNMLVIFKYGMWSPKAQVPNDYESLRLAPGYLTELMTLNGVHMRVHTPPL